jgi:4-amino-4-deoxy-L-arabinose transferase-like glycosyltransferase
MMDYEFPEWRSAARSHVRRLQLLQSKCLLLATGAPWYVPNRQLHEDLGVTLFAVHMRTLTASFDSKLADVESLLYGNSADTYTDRGLTPSPDTWAKGGSSQQASRGHRPQWPSRPNELRSALLSRALFGYPDWGFPYFFQF